MIAGCMGNRKHISLCVHCSRLPRSPIEEEGRKFISIPAGKKCGMFSEVGK